MMLGSVSNKAVHSVRMPVVVAVDREFYFFTRW